jgi:predicted nucleic acid-binding protein
VIYLDSSAIVKLILPEPESPVLRDFLATDENQVSSGLARVEVLRTVRRVDDTEDRRRLAERVLARVSLVAMSEPLLAKAGALGPPILRSLDAIHLATALSLDGLDAFVTYDHRVADAAREAGLAVASPT